MKYADARPVITSGDVIAFTHRGIRSWHDFKVWMVRVFTQSEYTHVGIAWVVADRVFILESVATGVRIFPLSLCGGFYLLPWTVLRYDQLELALSKAGQPYSYWECAKAYFTRLDPNSGSWECAKYVRTVLDLDCSETPSAVVAHLLHNGSTLTEIAVLERKHSVRNAK
jgi:hypothetical protein